MLRAAGYRTAAFVSNPWMETKFGFDQGFEIYDTSFARWGLENEQAKLPGIEVSAKALEWLATLPPGTPYFLFVHYLDSHRPYPPLHVQELAAHQDEIRNDHRELDDKERRELAVLVHVEGKPGVAPPPIEPKLSMLELAYDKGIEHFDFALERLLEGLAHSEEGRRAAVVVTADHGEALYERGYGNHGRGLHDDELAVPLAMKLPGVVGPKDGVSCLVGLVDVLPTLCTYLGVACPAGPRRPRPARPARGAPLSRVGGGRHRAAPPLDPQRALEADLATRRRSRRVARESVLALRDRQGSEREPRPDRLRRSEAASDRAATRNGAADGGTGAARARRAEGADRQAGAGAAAAVGVRGVGATPLPPREPCW